MRGCWLLAIFFGGVTSNPGRVQTLMCVGLVQVDPATNLQDPLPCVLASNFGCMAEVARSRLTGTVTKCDLLRLAIEVLPRQAT